MLQNIDHILRDISQFEHLDTCLRSCLLPFENNFFGDFEIIIGVHIDSHSNDITQILTCKCKYST